MIDLPSCNFPPSFLFFYVSLVWPPFCLVENPLSALPVEFEGAVHLQELYLYNCSNLRTLPSRMYQMTSLTSLELRECPSLQQIPAAISDESDKEKCAGAVLDFLRKATTTVRCVNLFGESVVALRFSVPCSYPFLPLSASAGSRWRGQDHVTAGDRSRW